MTRTTPPSASRPFVAAALLALAVTLLPSRLRAQGGDVVPDPTDPAAPPAPEPPPELENEAAQTSDREDVEGEDVEGEDVEGEDVEGEDVEGAAPDEDESTAGRAPSAGESDDASAEANPLPEAGATTWLTGRARRDAERFTLPPVQLESSDEERTTTVFPFFYRRASRSVEEWLLGPYYRRRGREGEADVAFPVFWSFREPDGEHLTIVPPVYYGEHRDGFDLGVAPLFFAGRDGEEHFAVIPPLLSATFASRDEATTIAGPFYRFRDHDRIDWGVFPLLWAKNAPDASRLLVPPLFFHFEEAEDDWSLTVVPPVYAESDADGAAFGLAPIFFHHHDATSTSTTVLPLFHHASGPNRFRLITPLFGLVEDDGDSTLVTPLYQRHRGTTELDAVAPVFWSWRDRRDASSGFLVPPLVYHAQDPAQQTTVVFPFFGLFDEYGVSTTWATPLAARWTSQEKDAAETWIFPSIHFSHAPGESMFNVYPLAYSSDDRRGRHLVLAPLYWDFEDYEDDDRATVLFPLFWRFRDRADVTQVVGNTVYLEGRQNGVPYWEFHFVPFFSYGEPAPGDHFWNVLFGLVGYRRQGPYAQMKLFYVPFTVDSPARSDD